MDHANAVLGEMVAGGVVTAAERARMTLQAHPRRNRDLVPFARDGSFRKLTVEDFEMQALPDAAWTDFQHDGNQEALANRHALFFRAVFVPSLASALDLVRSGDSEAAHLWRSS
jgi:hypothetical protein